MNPFSYVTAQSPESAVELVGTSGRYIGGGIDLLGEMKEYLVSPKTLVNVKALPGTREIRKSADAWEFGANLILADLAADPAVRQTFSGIAEAAAEVGSPQIRNVATLGGNLAQHSRCWYYRHRDVKCLKNGGAMCYARDNENKYHSLFTGNPCVSPVVSNLGTVLAALEATVEVQRGKTRMTMSIPDIYSAAWVNPLVSNSLLPGDLILSVKVPLSRARSTYLQISEKSDFDWALVSCGAAAAVENGVLKSPRLFLGSVAPIPYHEDEVHAFLEGKRLDESVAAEAADKLLANATPLAHNGYKVPMAKALAKRALLRLVG